MKTFLMNCEKNYILKLIHVSYIYSYFLLLALSVIRWYYLCLTNCWQRCKHWFWYFLFYSLDCHYHQNQLWCPIWAHWCYGRKWNMSLTMRVMCVWPLTPLWRNIPSYFGIWYGWMLSIFLYLLYFSPTLYMSISCIQIYVKFAFNITV